MKSKIGNWGGSTAVRLPKAAVDVLQLEEGQQVEFELDGNALIMKARAPRFSLAQLVDDAKNCSRPDQIDDEPLATEWPSH